MSLSIYFKDYVKRIGWIQAIATNHLKFIKCNTQMNEYAHASATVGWPFRKFAIKWLCKDIYFIKVQFWSFKSMPKVSSVTAISNVLCSHPNATANK